MDRRGFLGAILAAGVAPAVAKAGILMPVKPQIWTPERVTITGVHDLQIGDAFTIAGVMGSFVITEMAGGNLTIAQAAFP